jgi:hypothetical protein
MGEISFMNTTAGSWSAGESRMWRDHFQASGLEESSLPWGDAYRLANGEREAICRSIQQFQLGENARGRRLLSRGRASAEAADDPYFVEALHLFVREEQRHSTMLLRFMHRESITPVGRHWIDTVFRHVRVMAGLELELRVLVTAEIIAVPYYQALGQATKSNLLAGISERILRDETAHLRFQASLLGRLGVRRNLVLRLVVSEIQRLFLMGTSFLVWLGHRRVFSAAGYSPDQFVKEALWELDGLELDMARAIRSERQAPMLGITLPDKGRASR